MLLYRAVKGGLSDGVTLEQIPEKRKDTHYKAFWRRLYEAAEQPASAKAWKHKWA